MLSSLPRLNAIRPTTLRVESLEHGAVDANLLQHISREVRSTISDISVIRLGRDTVLALQDALSRFEQCLR